MSLKAETAHIFEPELDVSTKRATVQAVDKQDRFPTWQSCDNLPVKSLQNSGSTRVPIDANRKASSRPGQAFNIASTGGADACVFSDVNKTPISRDPWVATTINAPDLIHPVTTPIDQSPYSAPLCSTAFAINKAEIASASSTTTLRVVIILRLQGSPFDTRDPRHIGDDTCHDAPPSSAERDVDFSL